jgi:hypothetical protein
MNKYGELTKQERRAAAVELLNSMRGRYIMGQALALAHRQLAENEPSNAADMELFGLEFFDPWFSAALLVSEPEADMSNGNTPRQ